MIYEWIAYKIFINGKRAKRPSITFKHEDENTVGEYFESKENQYILKLQRETINNTYSWDIRSLEWKKFFNEIR